MRYRRIVVITLLVTGIAAFASALQYDQYLMHVSPSYAIEETQQIYQMNEHGHAFFITAQQHTVFQGLLCGGFAIAALGAVLNMWWKVIGNK